MRNCQCSICKMCFVVTRRRGMFHTTWHSCVRTTCLESGICPTSPCTSRCGFARHRLTKKLPAVSACSTRGSGSGLAKPRMAIALAEHAPVTPGGDHRSLGFDTPPPRSSTSPVKRAASDVFIGPVACLPDMQASGLDNMALGTEEEDAAAFAARACSAPLVCQVDWQVHEADAVIWFTSWSHSFRRNPHICWHQR